MKLVILGVVALVALSASAEAQMRGPGVRPGRGMPQPQQESKTKVDLDDRTTVREILTFSKELGLSEEQAAAIRIIRSAAVAELRQKYETLTAEQMEFSESVNDLKPDFAKLRAKVRAVNATLEEIQLISVDAYEKAFNTLTPAQKQKLFVIRTKLKEESKPKDLPQEAY